MDLYKEVFYNPMGIPFVFSHFTAQEAKPRLKNIFATIPATSITASIFILKLLFYKEPI